MPLLRVEGLKKHFPVPRPLFAGRHAERLLLAVDDVSFAIHRGETFGLVGESGCGKSTVGRLILRLLPPTAGQVLFHGRNLFTLGAAELLEVRKRIQIIFQDPYAALNPRMTVGQILREPLDIYRIGSPRDRPDRVAALLRQVGLHPKDTSLYPRQLSGGMRQRVGVAVALALGPELIVADEPVSALDVSIQAQILNLLADLQKTLGLSYLFISHDLSVVEHVSDRVGVMYVGKLVEVAPVEDLFARPLHPYTRALLSAIPSPDPEVPYQGTVLEGEVPTPINPPLGCRFHTRCPMAEERCVGEEPPLRELRRDHWVACHFAEAT